MKIPHLKKKHYENSAIGHQPNYDNNSDAMITTIYTECDRKYGSVTFLSVKNKAQLPITYL